MMALRTLHCILGNIANSTYSSESEFINSPLNYTSRQKDLAVMGFSVPGDVF